MGVVRGRCGVGNRSEIRIQAKPVAQRLQRGVLLHKEVEFFAVRVEHLAGLDLECFACQRDRLVPERFAEESNEIRFYGIQDRLLDRVVEEDHDLVVPSVVWLGEQLVFGKVLFPLLRKRIPRLLECFVSERLSSNNHRSLYGLDGSTAAVSVRSRTDQLRKFWCLWRGARVETPGTLRCR